MVQVRRKEETLSQEHLTGRQMAFDQSHAYVVETRARQVRLTTIEVVDKTSSAQNAFFGVPGTLTVFIARKGSDALHELRQALNSGGKDLLQVYHKIVEQTVAKIGGWTPEETVQATIQQSVFADLRYGETTLAQGLSVLQGLDMRMLFLPYNGGRLAPEGLILAERFTKGSDVALEALVVRVDPPLTPAEKFALQLVPADLAINNSEPIQTVVAADVAAIALTVAAVAATPIGVAAVTVDEVVVGLIALVGRTPYDLEFHITEETLKQVGPTASVHKLLAMRRDFLSNPRREAGLSGAATSVRELLNTRR
ncbi:hypothetical protein KSF_075800 [Reticulibacter mediterranei]|uniref:Uncharacterized protein n=1 Tax=Reticulibacter mediterranei TaxID=2778369 RepID=A0A8J3N7U3_9CHLR|nr:hypothetical protein [Reticulibacter mediterranei]GHO97532.1 hypothetical protein KSF_075800 [Reticulibacter mediterranei]